MRELTSFPIQKLCYDLELEVLEQMGPEDTIELAKVNAGFRSILLRTPWLVFGRHVHRLRSQDDWIWVTRRPHDSCLRLDATLHFPLFKRIHSCDLFEAWWPQRFSDQNAAMLNHLSVMHKSVKNLDLSVNTKKSLLKFLKNFRSVIEESTDIDLENIGLWKENRVISKHFKNFVANQMNDCERVLFACTSAAVFHFYYALFAKTSIKFLEITGGFWDDDGFEKGVQSIVEEGIPTKNLKAGIYMYSEGHDSEERDCRIVDFLSRFPEMKHFVGENQQKVARIAREILDKHLGSYLYFTEKSDIFRYFFWRNIDSRRDCVYMFGSFTYWDDDLDSGTGTGAGTEFFAFYTHPQSGRIEF